MESTNSSDSIIVDENQGLSSDDNSNDVETVQNLIRSVLNWSDTTQRFDLYPLIEDATKEYYIGFDMTELEKNIETLRLTGYFTEGFIKNYKAIILTLDKKIKNGDYGQIPVGDLLPFGSDADPWMLSQDVPYDTPNPFDNVIVEVSKLDDKYGELVWRWGRLDLNPNPDWKEQKYEFKVSKEKDKWQISYLKGFDYQENTRLK